MIKKEPMADYLASKTFDSGSDLKNALRSPRHYAMGKSEISDSTPSMNLGTMVHTMVLEPETFKKKYFVFKKEMYPFPERSPLLKENKEARELKEHTVLTNGGVIVAEDLFDQAVGMATSIMANPTAFQMFKDCDHREESIYVKLRIAGQVRQIRIRPDAYGKNFYISLKTTKDASPNGFEKEANNYMYALSEALYFDIISQVMPSITGGYIVAVESAKPYNCAIYDILQFPEFLEYGRWLYKRALKIITDSSATDHRQGYEYFHPEGKSVFGLGVPEWALKMMNQ